jgi:hypothetical protein
MVFESPVFLNDNLHRFTTNYLESAKVAARHPQSTCRDEEDAIAFAFASPRPQSE